MVVSLAVKAVITLALINIADSLFLLVLPDANTSINKSGIGVGEKSVLRKRDVVKNKKSSHSAAAVTGLARVSPIKQQQQPQPKQQKTPWTSPIRSQQQQQQNYDISTPISSAKKSPWKTPPSSSISASAYNYAPLTQSPPIDLFSLKLLQQQQQHPTPTQPYYATPTGMQTSSPPFRTPITSTPVIRTFQHASRSPIFQAASSSSISSSNTHSKPSATTVPSHHQASLFETHNGPTLAFTNVLAHLAIPDQALIPASNALKRWIHAKIIAPLVQAMKHVDVKLDERGLGHLKVVGTDTVIDVDQIRQVLNQPQPMQNQVQGFGAGGFSTTSSFGVQKQAQPALDPQLRSLLETRIKIEPYLSPSSLIMSINGQNGTYKNDTSGIGMGAEKTAKVREYVLQRLLAFGLDEDLSTFRFASPTTGTAAPTYSTSSYQPTSTIGTGGLNTKTEPGGSSTLSGTMADSTLMLPTDAELVFAWVRQFMDDKMAGLGVYTDPRPFTRLFIDVVSSGSKHAAGTTPTTTTGAQSEKNIAVGGVGVKMRVEKMRPLHLNLVLGTASSSSTTTYSSTKAGGGERVSDVASVFGASTKGAAASLHSLAQSKSSKIGSLSTSPSKSSLHQTRDHARYLAHLHDQGHADERPGQVWYIPEGRTNVFYALLVFLKYYHTFSGDYLDSLFLGGSVGLVDVVRGLDLQDLEARKDENASVRMEE